MNWNSEVTPERWARAEAQRRALEITREAFPDLAPLKVLACYHPYDDAFDLADRSAPGGTRRFSGMWLLKRGLMDEAMRQVREMDERMRRAGLEPAPLIASTGGEIQPQANPPPGADGAPSQEQIVRDRIEGVIDDLKGGRIGSKDVGRISDACGTAKQNTGVGKAIGNTPRPHGTWCRSA